MMGDRRWAEVYLSYGKDVSHSYDVLLFTFAFSYHLGRVYVMKRDGDSAEKEFQYAKKILDSGTAFCCQQCRLLFEACMYESLGDLRNTCEAGAGGEAAKFWYTQALEKLISKWTKPLSFYEEGSDDAKCAASKTCSCSVKASEDIMKSVKSEVSDSPDMLNQKESVFSKISKLRCWRCLPPKVVKSGSVKDFINLKWEFLRRKLSMNLLTQLAKISSSQIEVGEVLVANISLLVGPNPFCQNFSSIHLDLFRDLVVKDLPGDIFAIERAEMIYDICWYSLKFYHSRFTSNIFCNLSSSFKFEHLASWLMVAFVLAREVPVLFEKVSTLLALMYVVSASHEQFSLSSISEGFGEDNWSLYFHINSIGPHFTSQLLSHLTKRCKVPYVVGSPDHTKIDALRLVPGATTDLPGSLEQFMDHTLTSTTIIGISLLPNEYTSLLRDLLGYHRDVEGWVIFSRFPCKTEATEAIVMLLPLGSILQAEADVSALSKKLSEASPNKNWMCPWGSRVVDHIAPAYKTILEANYLSNRKQKNFEDSFLGSWKCLLLGEELDCEPVSTVPKALVKDDLRSKYKLKEKVLSSQSQQSLEKDCFIAKLGYCEKGNSGSASKELLKSKVEEAEGSVNRKQRGPVILLLNHELHMLPWENLPILKNHEVYRMPSFCSIFAVLDNYNHKEQVGRNLGPFPTIDPNDAFYLLNPAGDLRDGQKIFEEYFSTKNIKGMAGFKPKVEDLAKELKSRDLFIYSGHGNGEQCFSWHDIQKLEKCGATLLLGCGSGCLKLHGNYAPEATPFSYLLVGSPTIVACLWEVTGRELHLFFETLFNEWLEGRSATECSQCKSSQKELEFGRNKLREMPESSSKICSHIPKMGAFIGKARQACNFHFTTGASLVNYGIPTRICSEKK